MFNGKQFYVSREDCSRGLQLSEERFGPRFAAFDCGVSPELDALNVAHGQTAGPFIWGADGIKPVLKKCKAQKD